MTHSIQHGTILVRRTDNSIARVWRRKADNTGWWLTDGSGLRDDVLARFYDVREDPPTVPPDHAVLRWHLEGL